MKIQLVNFIPCELQEEEIQVTQDLAASRLIKKCITVIYYSYLRYLFAHGPYRAQLYPEISGSAHSRVVQNYNLLVLPYPNVVCISLLVAELLSMEWIGPSCTSWPRNLETEGKSCIVKKTSFYLGVRYLWSFWK